MYYPIPLKVKKYYQKIGFTVIPGGSWKAEFVKNENESITIDFAGTVYVHCGYTKYGTQYLPKCVDSFMADSIDKINVLVKPLMT